MNLIYGTICDYCTETSCPTMSGGPKFEYLWADGRKFKKPTALPANQYISLLMDWIEAQINDEKVFPVTVGEGSRVVSSSSLYCIALFYYNIGILESLRPHHSLHFLEQCGISFPFVTFFDYSNCNVTQVDRSYKPEKRFQADYS